mgnify:FL=1
MHEATSQTDPRRRLPRVIPVAVSASLLVLVADQLTKSLAVNRLLRGPTDPPGPFRFRLMANRGALLGMPVPIWVMFAAATIIATIAISSVTRTTSRSIAIGWALLLGGAMGNLVDRFRHRPGFPDHAVVDWIASNSLPTFNLADAAIVAGVVVLALSSDPRVQGPKSVVRP